MGSKANSYKNYPVVWTIEILDQDITEYITKESVGAVSSSLDIVDINEVQRGRCSFTIQDASGTFDPEKSDNFFILNMWDQSGMGAKVVIRNGFVLPDGTKDLTVIFTGEIQKIDHNAGDFTFVFLCGDPSLDFRKKKITDFGIEKAVELVARNSSSTGRYPFPSILSPPSLDSVSNPRSEGGTTLNEKETLKTEGFLNKNNFKITNNILETEGGPRERNDNPLIDFKAPYRWISIEKIIDRIAAYYNQSKGNIEILRPTVNEHITLVGHPGYYIENNDYGEAATTPWRYNGYITDFVANTSNDKLYLLYSSTNSSTHPHIVEYNITTDTFQSIYQHSSHLEWWKIGINGTDLFIVGSNNTGSDYDTKNTGVDTNLYRYDTANNTFTTLVQNSDNHPPQMGVYYKFGNENRLVGTVPDSRKPLIVYNGRVYYIAYNRVGMSGCVASVALTGGGTRNEINIPSDNRLNHLGFCMFRTGRNLFLVSYSATDSGATRFVSRKTLP